MGAVTLLSRLKDGSLLGSFGRDVTYLTSGAVVAQAILIASQLALARIYTPAEFGAFLRAEMDKIGRVVREARITME